MICRTETDIPAAINHKKLVWLMAESMSVLIGSVTSIQADTLMFCLRTVSLPKFSHRNNICHGISSLIHFTLPQRCLQISEVPNVNFFLVTVYSSY